MRYVKWTLIAIAALMVAAFLHYNLPKRDIAYITNVSIKYEQFGENSIFWASPETGTNIGDGRVQRDVRFIDTIRPNGRTMVYRNEDTGWGWPPYFKFDSADLQAKAANLASTREDPNWVAITYYGWRFRYLNIYPNAVAIRDVEGPDEVLIPWVNIVILAVLAGMLLLLWRMWQQFRERTLDPALARAGEALEAVDARADAARDRVRGAWGRFRDRLASWIGRTRR
jgi:hypothetical protein